MKNPLTLLASLALASASHAAEMTWSLTAPTMDGADISNFTSSVDDAGNLSAGADSATYVANNQPGKGQTFTTGSNPGGYTLHSISYQQAPYDHAFSVDDGWIGFGGFWVSAGQISGGTYDLALANEYIAPGDTSAIPALDAGGNQFGTANAWATWTFSAPIHLDSNTTYAVSVWSDNPYFELAGTSTGTAYAGGEAFTESTGTVGTLVGDRVFHLDIAASAAPSPDAPDPHTTPVQVVDLSGTWAFDPNDGPPTTIQVPGGGWYKQGFTTTSEATYETTIDVPELGPPQVTRLEFGAVNYQADLYVDNIFVGSSTQSHTAASFDITDHVTPGTTHDIRLVVKGHDALLNGGGQSLVPNGARSWANFLPQGIFRSAELQIFRKTYISDVFIRTSVASDELYYDVWLQNATDSPTDVTLTSNLDSWNGDSWSYPSLPDQNVTLPPGTTKITVGPVTWGLGSTSYWWPNVPYQSGYTAKLHNLNLSLEPSGGGTPMHVNTTRFGFRECLQVAPDASHSIYTLNGTRVNFRGDSLQGANYDRIDNGGQGDAFSTYPGFLPGPNGWPKAVDNYQRLNYNVVRIHQIPATPYMLDVCDEMGLMIIDETGIRGAGNQQDFVGGHDNMVQHLKDLFTQNRNHASIIRQSISNEPDHSPTNSDGFQVDLYNAAMEVDGTRPLSIDAAWFPFDALNYPNFSVFRHYGEGNNKWGQYTDEVFERTDRPYGSGEHLWDHDNTAEGFAWFATSTQAMRAKGASDVRPYTLLSAWASVIPGTHSQQMRLENPPWNTNEYYPLYGEDNLPDPWSNGHIQRVQAGFNPVLVADEAYWQANKFSNADGDWPAVVPMIHAGDAITRTLNLYNDTFSGTVVDVSWELRLGSATGTVADSGTINANVPLGTVVQQDISFTAPSGAEGTDVYLVLSAEKGGIELFREESQFFRLTNATPVPLANGSFEQPDRDKISNGFDATGQDNVPGWNDYGAMTDSGIESKNFSAQDGDYAAYFMGPEPTEGGAYQMTGYTIQAGDVITLGFWARADFQSAANNAHLTGVMFWNTVNDPSRVLGTTLADNLSSTSWTYHEVTVTADDFPTSIGQELGVHFFNPNVEWAALDNVTLRVSNTPAPPTAPTGLLANPGDGEVALDWADHAEPGVTYSVYRSTTSGGGYSAVESGLATSEYTDNTVTNGTIYYYVVTAGNVGGESLFSTEQSATPLSPGQQWRQSEFGTIENTGDAADTADPDHDLISNLLERAFGGDPNVADPEILPSHDASGSFFSIKYRRAIAATDLAFVVQESTDLTSPWNPASGTEELISADGNVELIRFIRPPAADDSLFLRLEVSEL